MPRLIQDEFTMLEVSPQRKYQMRRERDGRCRICGRKGAPYCPPHAERQKRLCTEAARLLAHPEDVI